MGEGGDGIIVRSYLANNDRHNRQKQPQLKKGAPAAAQLPT